MAFRAPGSVFRVESGSEVKKCEIVQPGSKNLEKRKTTVRDLSVWTFFCQIVANLFGQVFGQVLEEGEGGEDGQDQDSQDQDSQDQDQASQDQDSQDPLKPLKLLNGFKGFKGSRQIGP